MPLSFLKPHTIFGTPTRKDWAHHFISLYLYIDARTKVCLQHRIAVCILYRVPPYMSGIGDIGSVPLVSQVKNHS